MNLTSNWSHCIYEHAASVYGEDTPWKKTGKADAMPFQAATTIDWSSVPLRFYTDILLRFCSSPEPETNSGMYFFYT